MHELGKASVQHAANHRGRVCGPQLKPGAKPGLIIAGSVARELRAHTARNRAIDRLRRESTRHAREREAMTLHDPAPDPPADLGDLDTVPDDQLRLIFLCCHPALGADAQVALTLRLLGGLTTTEIARAFLVPPPTIEQRLSRAKRKIRDTHWPTGSPRPPSSTSGSDRSWPPSYSSTPRATRRTPVTICSARPSPARRSASGAPLTPWSPASPRPPGSWR